MKGWSNGARKDKWRTRCRDLRGWANVGKGGNEREQLTLTNLEKIQLHAMRLKQLIAAIVASEQMVFAVLSTPKYGGQGFLFKGCAQVANVR